MTIALIAAGLVLASGPIGDCGGTLGKSSGTLGGYQAPAAGYGGSGYRSPGYSGSTAPRAPVAPRPPTMDRAGDGGFKPYKGQSTYSNRGGINAYPGASKPKGYINTYGD